jgi:hypothetical protein
MLSQAAWDFLGEQLHADVARQSGAALVAVNRNGGDHVMLPGMKQRMEVPSDPVIGQTIVLPARFGSVITASSGTSNHSLSMRTR